MGNPDIAGEMPARGACVITQMTRYKGHYAIRGYLDTSPRPLAEPRKPWAAWKSPGGGH